MLAAHSTTLPASVWLSWDTSTNRLRGPEGDAVNHGINGRGFRSHNHIQLCIRSESSIKGYFRPIL